MTTHIELAHGNGGRLMRELIRELFARHLANPLLDTDRDAAPLPPLPGPVCVTSDSFIVQPLEFPGGNIGTLAVNGTLNDLAVSGARPRYLTLNAILEEGLELSTLNRIIECLALEASRHNVAVVCGDTKVVRHGEGGGIYLSTTGIGELERPGLGMQGIRAGDVILVSGPIGDHGSAVLLAREQFDLRCELRSDCAAVYPLCAALYPLPGLRFLRDPTRGGLASVGHEICQATGLGVRLTQSALPIRPEVQTLCNILGFEPLQLACEGRVVAIVSAEQADTALECWKQSPAGADAAIIGHITSDKPWVVLETTLGGERLLPELEHEPLPRIC